MARSRALKICAAFGAALLLVAGGATAAVADQLAFDGDGLAPFDPQATQVEACTDESVQFTVLIAARRNGGGGNVFADGSAVTVAFVPAQTTQGMTATLVTPATIAIPAGWAALGSSADSVSTANIPATVTLPAKATGGSGTLAFSYSGRNSANGVVAGTSTVPVSWTTSTCSTDSVAPVLSLPAGVMQEATSAAGAVVVYSASATDETSPATPAVTCSPASGTVFPLGTTTVSCSATDAAGNTRSGTFPVLVTDTTRPLVGAVADIEIEATDAQTNVTWTTPTASDAVSGSPAVSCSPESGTGFPVGLTTVTCSATDAAGNTGSSTFTVLISDTTDPSLVTPSELTVEATSPAGAQATWTATAQDDADPQVDVVCDPESNSLFALGDATVQCTATDDSGNSTSGSFTVHVVDTTDPDITATDPDAVEATGPTGAVVEFDTSATDIVDVDVLIECDSASGSVFPVGTTVVSCTATDDSGNTDTTTVNVTVVDHTPPVVDVPGTMIVEATSAAGATVTFAATASDIVDQTLEVTCVPESGATFAIGNTQVDCSTVDDSGNEGTASFAVTVRDTTPPTLTLPDPITQEAVGPDGNVISFTATAADIVDGSVTPECMPASGSTFPVGTTTVTCGATDAHDNAASGSFDVIVEDTTAPVITWVGGPAHAGSYVFGSVPAQGSCTASDLVDGSVPCEITGYGTTVGSHTATAKAKDSRDNVATESRTYTVAAWKVSGFYQPVDMSGVWNSVKGGATVPLKFEVFAGSTELVGTSAVKEFVVKGVACPGSTVATDDIELTTTGGTSLRYDATAGQFIQNWQTPKKPGACYTVTMTTQDGTAITANFKLK